MTWYRSVLQSVVAVTLVGCVTTVDSLDEDKGQGFEAKEAPIVPVVYLEWDDETSQLLSETPSAASEGEPIGADWAAAPELFARIHDGLKRAGAAVALYDFLLQVDSYVAQVLMNGATPSRSHADYARFQARLPMALESFGDPGAQTQAVLQGTMLPQWYRDLFGGLFTDRHFYGHTLVTSERDERAEFRADYCRSWMLRRGLPDPLWPASGVAAPFGEGMAQTSWESFGTYDPFAVAALAAYRFQSGASDSRSAALSEARAAASALAQPMLTNVKTTCPEDLFEPGQTLDCTDADSVAQVVNREMDRCELAREEISAVVVRPQDAFGVPTVSASVVLKADELHRRGETIPVELQEALHQLENAVVIFGTRDGDTHSLFEGYGHVPGSWVIAWHLEKLAAAPELSTLPP